MRLTDRSQSDSVECPYLRIGITSRCNLDCRLCPARRSCDGLESSSRSDAPSIDPDHGVGTGSPLSDGEIVSIVNAAASSGIRKVRLTGGEPTERPDLTGLVSSIANVGPINRVCMTTNGTALHRHIHGLIKSGLTSVNLRIRSLRPSRYEALTGGGRLDDALSGLQAAQTAGMKDIHVTVPIVRGENDDEIESFVNLAIWHGVTVRFLEHGRRGDSPSRFDACLVPADEIEERILARHTLEPIFRAGEGGPSRAFSVDHGCGRVEFDTCVSRPPCWSCHRIEVTPDGYLRPCPQRLYAIDLKPLLEHEDAPTLLEQAFEDVLAEKRRLRPFDSGPMIDRTHERRSPARPALPRAVTILRKTPVGY